MSQTAGERRKRPHARIAESPLCWLALATALAGSIPLWRLVLPYSDMLPFYGAFNMEFQLLEGDNLLRVQIPRQGHRLSIYWTAGEGGGEGLIEVSGYIQHGGTRRAVNGSADLATLRGVGSGGIWSYSFVPESREEELVVALNVANIPDSCELWMSSRLK